MPSTPSSVQWLRAGVSGRADAVDREARVIRGYVMAQAGPFKSQGRGEFDGESLREIVRLTNAMPKGLKSRLGHPTMSDDGIGKFLGRARNARLGTARDLRTGKSVEAVRGDLHLDSSASSTPSGDLASYVMDLAESDPDALSSSLVLEVNEEYRRERDGTLTRGEDDEPLPPLWRPTRLHASDLVDTGDAVDGFLSAEEFTRALSVGLTPELARVLRFDNVARLASQMLDGMFAGRSRDEVDARCRAWLERYLAYRFPDEEEDDIPTPRLDEYKLKLAEADLRLKMRQARRKG